MVKFSAIMVLLLVTLMCLNRIHYIKELALFRSRAEVAQAILVPVEVKADECVAGAVTHWLSVLLESILGMLVFSVLRE